MTYQPFSVAISVYKNDNPEFFDRALESITDLQTVKPDEIVLVIDGPVSNEIDNVIEKYASRYAFNVIRLETNGGLGNALRIAVENAKNKFIARMDSDDISVNNRFEQQLVFFESNPNVDVLGGNITEFVEKEDNIISKRIVPSDNKIIREYAKKRCPFNHMTVMFKKDSVISAGGYIDWHYNEDYYLWIRMMINNAVFANLNNELVNVRVDERLFLRRGGLSYYKSEKKLQKYMLEHKIINLMTYLENCFKRFLVQCIMPNSFRGWFYKHFARKKVKA